MIPPGGEGEIKVTLTPKNGQESIIKHINVLSDDPAQPRFTLTMQGKMRVDLRALPANIQIRDLQPGAEGKARFEVHITDPRLTEIISVEVEDKKNFAIEPLPGTDETGIKHFYELRFFGQKEIGSIGSRVEIATTSPDTPQLFIPIRATVASNLRYAKRVQFVRRNGKIQQRPIRISTRDGKDPEIGKVEDPDGLLKLSVGKPDRGAVVIAASVDEEKLAGLDEAAQRALHELVVHTGDPDEPELHITYAVTASPTEGRAAVGKPSTAEAGSGH
ncbi:MAG: hypothetical protein KC431_07470 [Myxococcales bacterium]|nr:hypothetical protein [Myxococcales bacterium]MCA9697348.1 hypothetical protein [Myxococcales bacterium]